MATATRGSWPVHHYTDAVSAVHAMASDHTGDVKEQQYSQEDKDKISYLTPVNHPSAVRRQPEDREHQETQKPLTSIVRLKELHWVVSGSAHRIMGFYTSHV